MMFGKYKEKLVGFIVIIPMWSFFVIHSFGYGYKLLYCLVTLLILYSAIHISKVFAKTFVFVITFLACMLQLATSRFGPADINMVAAIKYTNAKEVVDMLDGFSFFEFLGAVFIAVLGIITFKLVSKVNTKRKYVTVAVIISLLFITYKPIISNSSDYNEFINEMGYPPIRFVVSVKNALNTISSDEIAFAVNKRLPSDFSPVVTNRKYNTYILVIGESVRRDYMGFYGFHVNNTPFLNSANGVFFDNYVSSSFATVPSLAHSLILSEKGNLEFNNNILRLAKLSGLDTYWLSNQGVLGIYDSPVAMIGKDADYSYFIKNGDSNDARYYPDEELLPEYARIIKEKGDKLIVLHLIGSHPEACSRTNGIYDDFVKSKEISCYVQSIKNTDALLKRIVDIANEDGKAWSLIYFADHGLSHIKNEDGLSHSDKYRENYSPPFMMINHDSNSQKRITDIRTGMDFVSMFSQWIGVSDKLIKYKCNYFINSICSGNAIVLDGSLHQKDFSILPSDPPDN